MLPILTTSPIHFALEGLENVLFELWSERVNLKLQTEHQEHRYCVQVLFDLLR